MSGIKKTIRLSTIENVKEFVHLATQNEISADLSPHGGRYIVDACSIMGVFSLDLSKPLTLIIYDDNLDEYDEILKRFGVSVDK